MIRAIVGAVLGAAMLAPLGAGQVAADDKKSYVYEWKTIFVDMSPEGANIIAEAIKAPQIPSNVEEVRRARQRVLDLISAESLDIAAIRKAQSEERSLAIKEHARSQEKMLKAYQRLSLSDRRAFARGMREREERIKKHMDRARDQMQHLREQHKRDADRMRRDMQRVTKETGYFWIILPAPVQSLEPVGQGG